MKMIKNFLLFLSIFAPLTNIYPALSILLGIKFSQSTLLFFVINILIILLNFRQFKVLIRKKLLISFLLFFLLSPFLISILTSENDFSYILINTYYLSLIFAGNLLMQERYKNLGILTLFSVLTFNLIATILSMIFPELFLIMAESFDKSVYVGGRGFGLFLQPNMLGHSAILIFLFSIFILRENKRLYFWALTISAITILLSGSRSSIAFIFIAIIIHNYTFSVYKKKFFNYGKYFLFVLSFALTIILTFDIKIKNIDSVKSLTARFESIITKSGKKDGSLLEREYKKEAYYERIQDSRILGYGIGSQFIHKNHGLLRGAAHNTHLEILYQGGILYYLFFLLFLIQLIYMLYKTKKRNRALWSYTLILISLFFLLSIVSSNLLQLRVLFVIFGPLFITSNRKTAELI